MSAQENTTREAILAAARSEFLEKGYQGASLREIAKKAGVTTGALYGYFTGKLDLFDALAGYAYQYTIDCYNQILQHFFQLPVERQQQEMNDATQRGMELMMDYMYDNRDAFKLILCCSEGTKYNELVHQIATMDVDATRNFRRGIEGMGQTVKPVNPVLEHMLTSGMFSAFFELIVHDVPREEAREYIHQLREFYTAGWMKIMGL